ncbi:MAG: oxidoreductase [Spirochaetaceae bacterium]|nr:MAG: oxidoreductase [Spirochaetaceae bacterium]
MTEQTIRTMQELIDGCMGDAAPYCQAACPMHTDVRGYVNLIGEGRFGEAIALIREKLFLPATLGRICAHPCEDSCKRGEVGAPMAIAALKRFVADNYDDPAKWDTAIESEKPESVAIIGSGPAGAQAAFDLRRKGYQVTIIDRLPVVGGMLRVGIPAYRLPRDIIELEYSLLKAIGVQFRMNTHVGTDVTMEELAESYNAVIVAVGAHTGIMPPVPGHDANGVFDAVTLLRDVSMTERFDALGSRVLVVGGGNVAIDAARSVRRLDDRVVHLACLECNAGCMPAHDWEVDEALDEGVSMHQGWGIVSINTDRMNAVESVTLKRCISVFDAAGRFAPVYDDGERKTIAVDSVVFAIGQKVDGRGLDSLPRTARGHIAVDEVTLQIPGTSIFAAGDATGHSVIAVEAMAEGRKAARSVYRMFRNENMREDRDFERAYKTALETEISQNYVRTPRVTSRLRRASERVGDFAEVDLGIEDAQALAEGGRCLSCECRNCVKECLMLERYTDTCPKDLFQKILNGEEIDPVIPYSCNMCSMCTVLCPKNYRMQDVFMEMRKDLVAQTGGKSPMKGHKAIYMHQKLGFSKLFNITRAASPARVAPKKETVR